jgi:hypothetical protein
VPGTGERLDGVFWGALVVSLIFGFFVARSLARPRVVQGTWTPVVHADIGPVTVYGGNRAWSVTYPYLTSHPSYALLLLLTAPIPAVMLAATINQGDSTFYFRVCGIVGLILLACMALARVLAWYVFRFGRRQLDEQLRGGTLPSGGEALLLAESLAVPDFKGMMGDVRNGKLTATGKVIDDFTAAQRQYYGFDESAFPEPSSGGRVMLLLSNP